MSFFDIITNPDIKDVPSIEELINASKHEKLPALFKKHMEGYLTHYIECSYRPCYHTIYTEIIAPHLDDVNVLKKVLKSDVIDESNGNVWKDADGHKMYSELFAYLSLVENSEIKDFLDRLDDDSTRKKIF